METFSPLSETFIYDTLQALEEKGVENHVVALIRDNAETRPFPRVRILRAPSQGIGARVSRKVAIKSGLRTIEDIREAHYKAPILEAIKEIQPDVIHAHFGPSGCMISPLARSCNIPMIVSFHGMDISQLIQQKSWIEKYTLLFQQVEFAAVLSEEMTARVVAIGAPREKLRQVKVAKRMDDFPYREPQKKVTDWISVGRMTEKKGFFDAIKSFGRATAGTGATLKIIGEGSLKEDLGRFIIDEGLKDRVFLLGGRPSHEVTRLVSAADAFLLCSKTAQNGDMEGTPTVLMEAQALGLPCVSTMHSGIPEIIPAANHWLLAPEGDIDEITKRMTELAACPVSKLQEMARTGREFIEREHNVDDQAKELISIYEQCQAKNRSR